MSNRRKTRQINHPGHRSSGAREADKRFKVKDPLLLSSKRIRKTSLAQYHYGLKKFLNWLPDGEQLWDGHHVDKTLRAFAHYVYNKYGGKYRTWVEQATRGVAFYWPEYAKDLNLIHLDLQGWRKDTPAQHKGPVPKIVAYALAHRLHSVGCADFAAAILLSYDCYFRVGDIYNLTKKSFIPKGEAASNNNFIVVIDHSKTKGENQSVEIRAPFLSRYITQILEARKEINGETRLMGLGRRQYTRSLELAGRDLDLPFTVTPHMFRFGGATHDFLNEVPLGEIRQRGRWISEKQCKEYMNLKVHTARLDSLSPDQQRRWSLIVQNPTHYFSNK